MPSVSVHVSLRGSILCMVIAVSTGLLPAATRAEDAAEPKALLVFHGRSDDRGYIAAAVRGLLQARAEATTPFGYHLVQRSRIARRFDDQQPVLKTIVRETPSAELVILLAQPAELVSTLAAEHPDRHFVSLDIPVSRPNVQSLIFREQEGGFLMGIAAAVKSTTGIVGFIGGMPNLPVTRFGCGFVQGARAARSGIRVEVAFLADNESAFDMPGKAREVAQAQMAQGADVLFSAAGASSLGVIVAAANAGRLAIGVDDNQNSFRPGFVLTSIVKRTDVAVRTAVRDSMSGTWRPGERSLGLAEGALDWTEDEHNARVFDPSLRARLQAERAKVIDGRQRVADLRADGQCAELRP